MVARCRKKTSHLADKPIRPPVTWVNKHLLPDFDHTIFPGCPIAQMGFTHMRFLFWSSYFPTSVTTGTKWNRPCSVSVRFCGAHLYNQPVGIALDSVPRPEVV